MSWIIRYLIARTIYDVGRSEIRKHGGCKVATNLAKGAWFGFWIAACLVMLLLVLAQYLKP